jgi:hydroxyacylglutathione hydrolase
VDDKTKDAVIIDPANPEEYEYGVHVENTLVLMWRDRVAPVLKEQIGAGKINLTAIVNTHQ